MHGLKPHKRPKWMKEETDFLILKALHQVGESGLRFNELLGNTNLSRETLSRHLKDLFKRHLINYKYLTKRYSISQNGSKKLEVLKMQNVLQSAKYFLPSIDQNSIQTLSSAKFISLGDMLIAIKEFITELVDALQLAGMLRPSFRKEDYEILRKCVTLSISSDKPLEQVDLQRPQVIPELVFVFLFNKDKLESLRRMKNKE